MRRRGNGSRNYSAPGRSTPADTWREPGSDTGVLGFGIQPNRAELLQESPGGRRVIREGNAVIRPCYPSSPAAHRLLRYLEATGFSAAPRFLGTDGTTEQLSYIAGEAGPAGWSHAASDEGLWALGRLLARYHEAVARYAPDPSDEWSSGATGLRPGQVMLHGDPGPWNVVWSEDGTPLAFIDWDHANPGDRLEDLGYLAAYSAPLVADDEEAVSWMRHPGPPDRRRRLQILADGYGIDADGLVDHAIAVMAKTNRTVERMARLGLEPQRTWAAETKLKRLWERHAWMVTHRPAFV